MSAKRMGTATVALVLVLLAVTVVYALSRREAAEDALAAPELLPIEGEVVAEPTAPPQVPEPIERDWAASVRVELEVVEKEMEIADGASYTFWTFGGTVPGRFIRVREGDEVEFHLKNRADSEVPHNIDLHAVTGPGGGAEATIAVPGEERVFRFRALNPGLYVYHCAMPGMIATHLANGMYGLILVEPAEGLPAVDREYYVMQGEFYTKGDFGETGHRTLDFAEVLDEDADYVLFNGRVGALTGEGALRAKTGETVRLFVGNGGPNLISSFHVIGEIFDRVRPEAGSQVNHDVQTTLVPAGGATIAEFRVDVPGSYKLVDHSIVRAANKGALGVLEVEGAPEPALFTEELVADELTTEE